MKKIQVNRSQSSGTLSPCMEETPTPGNNQAYSDPINILLIEDEEDDYILTRDALREMRNPACNLEWAATFETGLHIFHQHRHDLYLFDFRLGGRTGLDLLGIVVNTKTHAPIITSHRFRRRISCSQSLTVGSL